MTDQKKILILFDGSERSIQTLQYVGSLTPFKKFKLVLFNVFSGVPECYWDLERTPQNKHAISQLHAWESQKKKEIDSFAQNARQTLINAAFSGDKRNRQFCPKRPADTDKCGIFRRCGGN